MIIALGLGVKGEDLRDLRYGKVRTLHANFEVAFMSRQISHLIALRNSSVFCLSPQLSVSS